MDQVEVATHVNIGAGASGVLIGHATGVVTVGDLAVNDGTISTTATGVSIFDATALRVNIGGGASGVQIGHPTGTVVMGNIAANSGTISTIAVNSGNISTAADSDGWTALHLASFLTYPSASKCVEYLLQCGVDHSQKNSQGQAALHLAAANGSEKIVRLLISYGSQVSPSPPKEPGKHPSLSLRTVFAASQSRPPARVYPSIVPMAVPARHRPTPHGPRQHFLLLPPRAAAHSVPDAHVRLI